MQNFRDQLRVEGVNARGYGIIPKMVVLDRKLTIEAKAIYAYFCSYAGAGTTAFPSVNKIISDLCISKDRYYNHFNLLKKLGYISVEQVRDKGVFKHNIYTLVTNPEEKKDDPEEKKSIDKLENKGDNNSNPPCPENKDTDRSELNTGSQPCPENPDTGYPDPDNQDSNNNNLLYNQHSSLKTINHSIENERLNEEEKQLKLFLEKKQISEIYYGDDYLPVKRAIESLWYRKKPLITNNIRITPEQIKNDLQNLNFSHIDIGLRIFYEQAENQIIYNRIAYLGVCIYNAMFDEDLKIKNDLKYNGII